jgi:hypothetical protein
MADEMQTTIYQAICTSYNAINDWRAKLLGFLPLASGAGIFFLLNSSFTTVTTQGKSTTITTPLTQYLLPIGVVGALVTFGLFIYDIRAIQLRTSLVEAGKAIEADQPKPDGQFTHRPRGYGHVLSDTLGSTLIYFAVIAGWLFLGLIFHSSLAGWLFAGGVFIIGVSGALSVGGWIRLKSKSETDHAKAH